MFDEISKLFSYNIIHECSDTSLNLVLRDRSRTSLSLCRRVSVTLRLAHASDSLVRVFQDGLHKIMTANDTYFNLGQPVTY